MKLNNKAFTLIELLAVIVILAIIALIATPIVIDIISDTKESSLLRSAEFYIDGVEFSISSAKLNNRTIKNGKYNILENGNMCLEDYDETTKEFKDKDSDVENNELVIEVNGDKPNSGVVTVTNGEISDISLNLGNKDIVKNNNGELVYYESPCTIVTGDKNTPGSLYECEVKPGVKYNFYVLSQGTNGTTNLIMSRNINNDGSLATKAITKENAENGLYSLVAWNNESGQSTNAYGPVTAMKFLYDATTSWINIPALSYTYYDENKKYKSFISNNGIAAITPNEGESVVIGTIDKPLRARMAIYSTDKNENELVSQTEYLYVNEDCGTYWGYWTLSSENAADNSRALPMFTYCGGGYVYSGYVNSVDSYGVRPVINLKL